MQEQGYARGRLAALVACVAATVAVVGVGSAVAVKGPPGKDSVGHGELIPRVTKQIKAPGPQGPAGTDGVSGYEIVGRTADAVVVPPGETKVITTLCASEDSSPQQMSEKALGGGATTGGGTLNASYPHAIEQVSPPDADDPAGRWAAGGWAVEVTADATPANVQPYVICALLN